MPDSGHWTATYHLLTLTAFLSRKLLCLVIVHKSLLAAVRSEKDHLRRRPTRYGYSAEYAG